MPVDVREVYFEAVGVIITLILLGRLLEVEAKADTGEAIRKLPGLQAKTARVLRDGTEVEIPVEQVVPCKGIRATVDGREVLADNVALLADAGLDTTRLEAEAARLADRSASPGSWPRSSPRTRPARSHACRRRAARSGWSATGSTTRRHSRRPTSGSPSGRARRRHRGR